MNISNIFDKMRYQYLTKQFNIYFNNKFNYLEIAAI